MPAYPQTSAFAFVVCLSATAALFVLCGCDCQPDSDTWRFPPDPTAGPKTGEITLHDGERLSPVQRRQVAELTALLTRYYPVWDPERESENEFYERHDTTPEIERLRASIRQQVDINPTWRACLDEIHRALRPQFWVRDGNPPGFYIPSFQVVIEGEHPRGHLTMVFRISMLAPLYDYYERFRDPVTHDVETSLTPTRDTARLAGFVRDIIAKHYPDYRELPPEIGATRVPNIAPEDRRVDRASLADALFEESRRW